MSAQKLITDHLDLWTEAITKKSTAGRGSNGKVEMTGIKKLRELILELAVRGKLVEQDPDDEPAQELLERCLKAKATSVELGKLKKTRKHATITSDDIPVGLPKGWVCSRLDDLMRVINGRAYKKHEMLSSGTPLLRVGNLFTSNDWYYTDLELEEDKYIDSGDLIYAWSASFGPFIWNGGRVIYHYHIWKLDLFDEAAIDKRFLHLHLSAITEEIKSSGSGIAMIHMTKAKMEELIIPVPPLEEQHRILQKVDELMDLCDRLEQHTSDQLDAHETLVDTLLGCLLKPAEDSLTPSANATGLADNWARLSEHFDTLFTTEQSIDKLKQTILQLAVMGRLVEQDEGDESVIDYLNRLSKASQVNRTKKRKPRVSTSEIPSEQQRHLFPLSWKLCHLGKIAEFENGDRSSRYPNTTDLVEDGIPFFGAKEIVDGRLQFTDELRFITLEKFDSLSNGKLQDNDFVILLRGMVGKIARFHASEKYSTGFINAQMLIIRLPSPYIADYFQVFASSKMFKDAIAEKITGSAVKQMPASVLPNIDIPLPPPEEQHRIVQKVDELLALCDHLKERLNQASDTRCQLAGAVVEGALN